MDVHPEPALSPDTDTKPRYARFSRRFHAILIDWIILWVGIVAALFVGSTSHNDAVSRPLGIAVLLAALLYEPLLVWKLGGTLGHRAANLRVVDDRGGNVSLAKAVVRFVLKGILGLVSFIVMTATRRNQALHDMLTHSTVQIRNMSRAEPFHYIEERTDFLAPGMPSAWRRGSVTLLYLFTILVLMVAAWGAAHRVGLLSTVCVDTDRCSLGEKVVNLALTLAWLGLTAVCIGLGWRGRLPGARRDPSR